MPVWGPPVSHVRYFQPAAVGSNETTALIQVRKGERVLWASLQRLVLSAGGSTPILVIGDGDDTDAFMPTVTLADGAANDFVDGRGTYAGLEAIHGKLYNALDTVDVTYTAGGTPGATNPKVRINIVTVMEWGV